MAFHQVIWTRAALAGVRTIRQYIHQFNPYAAEKVAAEIIAVGNSLEDFPFRGRPVEGTALREVLSSYPYIIRYRVTNRQVVILRVRHTARRPTEP